MNDKKDLTSLTELFPTTPESEKAAGDSESPSGIEGLTDLLEPMAPTSPGAGGEDASFTFSPDPNAEPLTGSGIDPLASLPPVDPEIAKLAAEGSAEEVPESAPLAETPVGAAIQSELAPKVADLKHYSENLAPSSSPVVAATPYSLLIRGHLKLHEREALVQILTRENLDVREVELEPQFQAGHILIPRISEYAGVLIVQALRNSGAEMRLGPSERIYISKETIDDDALIFPDNPEAELLLTEDGDSPADWIPLTPDATVSDRKIEETLDTLHGSMNLKAAHVAHPQSPVFQDALEKLKRQLKFQAHHRGANALISFKYELHPLEGQTVYKLVVQATAVRIS